MIVWDILNIIIEFAPDIIIGAGPFFPFKSMGTGSQSGKLLFRNASDGNNIVNINQDVCLCVRDQMIFDASIPNEQVAVGSGTSLCCSEFFSAQSLVSGGAYAKRGINLPIMGVCENCTKGNKNYGRIQGGLIIGAVNSYIYCGVFNEGFGFISSRNNIIGSKYSCIGCVGAIDSIKYSSIISSCRSSITGYNCISSHDTIIGANYGKIDRSIQSTIIGGYKNYICDYVTSYSYASSQNFIGSGQYNEIYNGKIFQGCILSGNYSGLNALNSILSGQKNKITGSFNSSIISGNGNHIETCSTSVAKNTKNNFIGSGVKNYISSYSIGANKHYCGNGQSIVNGYENSVRNSSYSSILNGKFNCIGVYYSASLTGCDNNGITILNGTNNEIFQSPNSSILNGSKNFMGYKKLSPGSKQSNNVIANGVKNNMGLNCNSAIINGLCNLIGQSCESSILSGDFNIIRGAQSSTIIHGSGSCIYSSCNSTIDSPQSCISGSLNSTVISDSKSFIRGDSKSGISQNNAVISGYKGRICTKETLQGPLAGGLICSSAIIGGFNNLVEATVAMYSTGIIGGYLNTIRRSVRSGIFGGSYNILGATSSNYGGASIFNSSIIGGCKNCIKIGTKDVTIKDYRSCNNVIIGGYGNSFVCECSMLHQPFTKSYQGSVIIGGYKLQGLVTNSNGDAKVLKDLAQSENFSLRGNIYVNDNGGNRCKGITSLNLNSNQIITSICVVKGIIITMSYS